MAASLCSAPELQHRMHVDLTPSALALVALLGGASRSNAQQAARATFAALTHSSATDTSVTGPGDSATVGGPDTSSIDARNREEIENSEHHWYSAPAFLELRVVTARHSSVPSRMPITEYRNLYIVDVRAGWTITSNSFLSVEYAPSVVPLAISTRNPRVYVPRASVNCAQGKSCDDFTSLDISTVPLYTNTYGFGLTPVGFQLRLFRSWPVQLLTYANGGSLWFMHPIPDPEATRFNFTAELGGAIQVNLPQRLGLILGYSWHHTSNGGTGHVNPGLNSRALTVGIVARRER